MGVRFCGSICRQNRSSSCFLRINLSSQVFGMMSAPRGDPHVGNDEMVADGNQREVLTREKSAREKTRHTLNAQRKARQKPEVLTCPSPPLPTGLLEANRIYNSSYLTTPTHHKKSDHTTNKHQHNPLHYTTTTTKSAGSVGFEANLLVLAPFGILKRRLSARKLQQTNLLGWWVDIVFQLAVKCIKQTCRAGVPRSEPSP